jgi:hypothetical protein
MHTPSPDVHAQPPPGAGSWTGGGGEAARGGVACGRTASRGVQAAEGRADVRSGVQLLGGRSGAVGVGRGRPGVLVRGAPVKQQSEHLF